ncbi:MAG: hypothetical protein EOP06_09075 [Proteobacteria bacterium]|nr:MAG: hypothetical protein EOP06_09075 [Pseudomonadota bacterium]
MSQEAKETKATEEAPKKAGPSAVAGLAGSAANAGRKYLPLAENWMSVQMDKVYAKTSGVSRKCLNFCPFSLIVAVYLLWGDSQIGARSLFTIGYVFIPQLIVVGAKFLKAKE